ncbi:MAG: M23 family metallopeptidase, partial [Muribaculaceae bacterium]|nr:M23 family metallopeptidase [Muribaculaceae bacterium]
TIYANIKSLAVKTGDEVTQGQPVGVIAGKQGDGNRTILHFEIRKEKEKLDPELWLRH